MNRISSSSSISITDTDAEKTEKTEKEMKHYIINGKKREDYLRLVFFLITFSFVAGFILGYRFGVPTETETEGVTTINPAQENSKTDQALPVKTARLKEKKSVQKTKPLRLATAVKPKSATVTQPQRSTPAPAPAPAPKVTRPTSQATTSKSATDQSEYSSRSSLTEPDKKVTESANSIDETPAQYLVQVGRFSNKESASSFVEQLAESGFKVFAEEFISTVGDRKYNVRLGPFAEMIVAQEKMSDFQREHDTSAHILTGK